MNAEISGGSGSPSEDRLSSGPAASALVGADTCGGGVAANIGADSVEGRADAAEGVIRAGGVLAVGTALDRPTDMTREGNCKGLPIVSCSLMVMFCELLADADGGEDDNDDDVP